MSRMFFVLFLVLLCGCSGAQRGGAVETTPLGQARAIEIFEEAVASRDYGAVSHTIEATLTNGTRVTVDVLVRALGAGLVYLTEQDRRNLSGDLPPQAEGSQIYALLATIDGQDQQIHVFIVEDTDFTYLPNPRPNERTLEISTISDVEDRLRRDSLDFLHAIFDLIGGQSNS